MACEAESRIERVRNRAPEPFGSLPSGPPGIIAGITEVTSSAMMLYRPTTNRDPVGFPEEAMSRCLRALDGISTDRPGSLSC